MSGISEEKLNEEILTAKFQLLLPLIAVQLCVNF